MNNDILSWSLQIPSAFCMVSLHQPVHIAIKSRNTSCIIRETAYKLDPMLVCSTQKYFKICKLVLHTWRQIKTPEKGVADQRTVLTLQISPLIGGAHKAANHQWRQSCVQKAGQTAHPNHIYNNFDQNPPWLGTTQLKYECWLWA